jgi:signal transduction histidine kinase
MIFAFLQTGRPNVSILVIGSAVGLVIFALLGLFLLRRLFRTTPSSNKEERFDASPRSDNPSLFMAASMQGVIQKLREQEKELERLHRIEKERAEKTEQLSDEITRNMPAGLLVVNATGIIASSNPAAEHVLGIQTLGFRRYSEALGETSALSQLLAGCLAHGTIFRREEVEHITPAGVPRRLGVTISPIRRGGEEISGVMCLLTDLTELAALQQQMQLKENLAALGELSAGIAHEFKNALATISGYAQMIRAEGVTGEAAEYAQQILEQTRNITHVVTEFLKYARPLDISDEPVALQTVVERVVSEISEAIPAVHVCSEGQFGDVAGDEGLLRQALLNLARNAAEACATAPAGGRVVLAGEVTGREDSSFQRISVFDNGPGIPDADRAKIFHPFFTTKANGSGLGLAVVQKIIVQHGGQIEARNRPDGGAAFIVTLPVRRSVPEAVQSIKGKV